MTKGVVEIEGMQIVLGRYTRTNDHTGIINGIRAVHGPKHNSAIYLEQEIFYPKEKSANGLGVRYDHIEGSDTAPGESKVLFLSKPGQALEDRQRVSINHTADPVTIQLQENFQGFYSPNAKQQQI